MSDVTTGLLFMGVGMGAVVGFLVLMVCVMAVSAGILKNFPEEETLPSSSPQKKSSTVEAEIAAVIAIARTQMGK